MAGPTGRCRQGRSGPPAGPRRSRCWRRSRRPRYVPGAGSHPGRRAAPAVLRRRRRAEPGAGRRPQQGPPACAGCTVSRWRQVGSTASASWPMVQPRSSSRLREPGLRGERPCAWNSAAARHPSPSAWPGNTSSKPLPGGRCPSLISSAASGPSARPGTPAQPGAAARAGRRPPSGRRSSARTSTSAAAARPHTEPSTPTLTGDEARGRRSTRRAPDRGPSQRGVDGLTGRRLGAPRRSCRRRLGVRSQPTRRPAAGSPAIRACSADRQVVELGRVEPEDLLLGLERQLRRYSSSMSCGNWKATNFSMSHFGCPERVVAGEQDPVLAEPAQQLAITSAKYAGRAWMNGITTARPP